MNEIILQMLQQLPRNGDFCSFMSDGKNLICSSRREAKAIRDLLEAVFPEKEYDLKQIDPSKRPVGYRYCIELSDVEVPAEPFDAKNAEMLFCAVTNSLPHKPAPIWSSANCIFCNNEDTADIISDFFDQIFRSEITAHDCWYTTVLDTISFDENPSEE